MLNFNFLNKRPVKNRIFLFLSFFTTFCFVFIPLSTQAKNSKPLVKVGIFDSSPVCFIDKNGDAKGVFPELLNYIAEKENWTVEYILGTWTEGLTRLSENKIDIMLDVAYAPDRENKYIFSQESVFSSWATIYVPPGSKVETITDLEGKRISVMKNSIHTTDKDHGIISLLKKFHIKATYVETPGYLEGFRQTSAGKTDAAVVNRIFGTHFQDEYGLHNTGIFFNPVPIHFAFSKNSPRSKALAKALDSHLKTLKSTPNSFYYTTLQKNLFPTSNPPSLISNTTLLFGFIGVISIGLILFLIVLILKHQIKIKTKQVNQQNTDLKKGIKALENVRNDLTESQERLSLALEATNAGLWDYTPQTGDVYLSDRWFTMLGYGSDELDKSRQTWINLLHPEDKEVASQKMNFFIQNYLPEKPSVYSNEFRLKTKEGKWKWIHSLAKAFDFDQDGNITRMIGTHTDISAHKKALLDLQKSEMLHEKAQKLAHIGHWRRDLKTNQVIWSNEIYRIFEVEKNSVDIFYDYFIKNIHPEDRVKLESTVKKAIATHSDYDETYRILFENGRIKYLREQCSIGYAEDGTPTFFVGTTQDITEITRAEKEKVNALKQLRQAQKIKAIGTLAGGIAHDFNNILTPIIGYAQMGIEELPEENEVTEFLNSILKSSLRAKSLIRQILTFSREKEQEFHPIQIQPIIKETLQILHSTIPSTIEIKEDISSNVNLMNGDPTQLHQVIMNLCTNAFHAMKENGGILSIDVSQEHVSNPSSQGLIKIAPGSYLKLSVSDTGIGISRENIEKIFDPYFSTKETAEGTGLGLSVVHGIVESYGGEITVQSTLGKGSIFTVWFPTVLPEKTEAKVFVQNYQKGSEKILLVDDEPELLNMLKKMLSSLGYEVFGFNDSQAALEAFEKEPSKFDLILTDLTMPKLDGIALTKSVKPICQDIKIILCTGYSDDMSDSELGVLGIDTLLLKPITKSDLSKAIRLTLDTNLPNRAIINKT